MKKSIALVIAPLLFCLHPLTMFAQVEIESEITPYYLNNIPVDKTPPNVKVLIPALSEGETFSSKEPEIDLIGQSEDESGISFVAVNAKLIELGNEGIFNTKVQLEKGQNMIKIVSVDRENNRAEKTYLIDYVPPVLTLADKINEESEYYGLIIGINEYENINDLSNPISDAQNLYDILTAKYTFKEENITFLKNATRGDITDALDEIADKVTPEDNLLVFYAGHGTWDSTANIGYWLPSDARQERKADWFRNSTLVDYIKEIQSKHTLLIADACFGGAIFKTRTAFPDLSKAYEKLYELPSRKAMTSGSLTEVPDRSAFIKYLIESLESNHEQYLSSEQLFSSFKIAVINNSNAVPQFGEIKNVGDQGGDFIFIKK